MPPYHPTDPAATACVAPGETQIGEADKFDRLVPPGLSLGLLVLLGFVGALNWWSGGGRSGLIPLVLMLLFAGVVITVDLVYYRLPLKNVWQGDQGLRVADQQREVAISYAAIRTVTQRRGGRTLYVVVQIEGDLGIGRRFTFLPIEPYWLQVRSAFGGTSPVVANLRQRVAAAQAQRSKTPPKPGGSAIWSAMADAEVDSQF